MSLEEELLPAENAAEPQDGVLKMLKPSTDTTNASKTLAKWEKCMVKDVI